MGTRTGTIVLGTIVPIRLRTCYGCGNALNAAGLVADFPSETRKKIRIPTRTEVWIATKPWRSFLGVLNVGMMQKPPLDPDVADSAPDDPVLTSYDEQHLVTYWRLLDAETDGADWKEVARIVLHIDPDRESVRARKAFDSHLARAKWMADHGYRDLLRGGATK